jgi:hypothetical protein
VKTSHFADKTFDRCAEGSPARGAEQEIPSVMIETLLPLLPLLALVVYLIVRTVGPRPEESVALLAIPAPARPVSVAQPEEEVPIPVHAEFFLGTALLQRVILLEDELADTRRQLDQLGFAGSVWAHHTAGGRA